MDTLKAPILKKKMSHDDVKDTKHKDAPMIAEERGITLSDISITDSVSSSNRSSLSLGQQTVARHPEITTNVSKDARRPYALKRSGNISAWSISARLKDSTKYELNQIKNIVNVYEHIGDEENLDFKWTVIDTLRLKNYAAFNQKSRDFAQFDRRKDIEFLSSIPDAYKSKLSVDSKTDSMKENSSGIDYILFRFNMESRDAVHKIFNVNTDEFKATLGECKKDKNFSFIWIEISNVNSLELLKSEFNLHPLIVRGFLDTRAEPTFVKSVDGSNTCLLSILYMTWDSRAKPVLKKQFLCIGHQFVITFMFDIRLDLDESAKKEYVLKQLHKDSTAGGKSHNTFRPWSRNFSVTNVKNIDQLMDLFEDNDIEEEYKGSPTAALIERLPSIHKHCVTIGPFYILYELWREIIQTQKSMLECVTRSIRYFKQQLTKPKNYRENISLLNKIHTVEVLLGLIVSHALRNQESLGKLQNVDFKFIRFDTSVDGADHSLVSKNMSSLSNRREEGGINNISKIEIEQDEGRREEGEKREEGGSIVVGGEKDEKESESLYKVYLTDLLNLFEFTSFYSKMNLEQFKVISSEIDIIEKVKIQNQNMVFAIIATIFWPLSTLATFFGMNFASGGDLSIRLLNERDGPRIFIGICVWSFVVCVYFFQKIGWVEPIYVVLIELYLESRHGKAQHFIFRTNWERSGVFKAYEVAVNPKKVNRDMLKIAKIVERDRNAKAIQMKHDTRKSLTHYHDVSYRASGADKEQFLEQKLSRRRRIDRYNRGYRMSEASRMSSVGNTSVLSINSRSGLYDFEE